MDDASTGIISDVLVGYNTPVLLGAFGPDEEVEEGLVALPNHLRPLKLGLDLVVLPSLGGLPLLLAHDRVELGKPSLGEIVELPRCFVLDLDVVHLGMDAKGNVGWEGPRRGGPGHEGGVLLIFYGEADDNGRIAHVFVVEARLEVAEGGPARRTEGHDLVALVD